MHQYHSTSRRTSKVPTMTNTRGLLASLLALLGGSVGAFVAIAPAGRSLRSGSFMGTKTVFPTLVRDSLSVGALHGSCPPRRCTARMLTGQEFATCSDEEFQAYIIGWTFAWSGIIPYTIIAAKNVLGSVVSSKIIPAVARGEEATVSNQVILLYNNPIKLLDVVNIIGRFETWVLVDVVTIEEKFDDVQSARSASGETSDYLRRDAFKESLRKRKFKGWPKAPDGRPALTDAFGGDVSTASRAVAKRELSESAMNAVFDSFCGSPLSMVADRFKVDNQLDSWRKDSTFDIKGFEGGLLFARFTFLFTIFTVFALEAAGYGVFFVEPLVIRYGNPLAVLGF